jgi:hypothetical protein
MTEYRVGQEVEVTYRARVAEVDAGIGRPRSGVRLRLEALAPAVTGWVEPEAFGGFSIKVITPPLPTQQGMYARVVGRESDDEYDTDGFEFYYLNAQGNWCDVGWGQPSSTDVGPNLLRWAGFGEPPTPV